jgi:hypothetical protein
LQACRQQLDWEIYLLGWGHGSEEFKQLLLL